MGMALLALSCGLLLGAANTAAAAPRLLLACEPANDLLAHLPAALKATRFASAAAAIGAANSGDTVMVLADGYPATPTVLSPALFATAKAQGAKLFVEFPAVVPGLTIGDEIEAGNMTFQRLPGRRHGSVRRERAGEASAAVRPRRAVGAGRTVR